MISREIRQPSGEEGETVTPSTFVRRPRWFTQTLRDAQEYVETPRSTFIDNKHDIDEKHSRFRAFQLLRGNKSIGMVGCHGGWVHLHHEE
jgi:hypothetical protein